MTHADLLAAGWRPYLDQHFIENPLRTYLVIPVRTDDGCWFGVPMMYGVTADPELYAEAERIAVSRYKRKIARAK
jgi:hypothetical protein